MRGFTVKECNCP